MLTRDDVAVREVLIKAHDRLDKVGFKTGNFGPPEGPNCALGAIGYSIGLASFPLRDPCEGLWAFSYIGLKSKAVLYNSVQGLLKDILGGRSVWAFNDLVRDKYKVQELFQKGINMLEEELYKDNIEIKDRKEILVAA